MALKALMLRKRIDEKTKALDELRAKDAEFVTREAELEASINEATTDEENATVEAAVESFETEKAAHEEAKANLEREVGDLEGELKAEEEKQDTTPAEQAPEETERKDNKVMETRDNFMNMNTGERDAFFRRDDVKGFLGDIRGAITEKRALTNAGLTIPKVMLGIIRENIINYSKLYRRVAVRRLSGNGREIIMGTVPEAIWTECCASLNEIDLVFNDVEIDCNKVGAFIPVCNATLEDSDIDLANEILTALGQAIGLALDKAILYGTGSKMPLGIVTRLAQTEAPSDYPTTARPWVDLHSTNIRTIPANTTGVELFQAILLNAGVTYNKYSRGTRVWCMNEKTRTTLVAAAMSINSAGAIVSAVNGSMPVVGGDLEVLDFIPDNVIIGGYVDLYLLGERRTINMERSEHYRFLQDQTVFKATARYDGLPVIPEAFVAIGLEGTTPSASMSFSPDDANTVQSIILNTNALALAVNATKKLVATTLPVKDVVTWESSDDTTATVDAKGTVKGKAAGTATITATSGNATATCAVTVS